MSLTSHVRTRLRSRAAAVTPAIAASLILMAGSPAAAHAQPGSGTPSGSGAPPRSFWGNTAARTGGAATAAGAAGVPRGQ